MARLRSTVHIYRDMLSHKFKGASEGALTLPLPDPSKQLLRCQITQVPITIQ
jgi:hypothetical protein